MREFPFRLRKNIVCLLFNRDKPTLEKANSFDETIGLLKKILTHTEEERVVDAEVVKFEAFPAGALANRPLVVKERKYLHSIENYLNEHMFDKSPGIITTVCECYSKTSKPKRGRLYYLAINHKSSQDAKTPFEGLFLQIKTRK